MLTNIFSHEIESMQGKILKYAHTHPDEILVVD